MRFTADPGVPAGAACKSSALKSTGEEVRACADGMESPDPEESPNG